MVQQVYTIDQITELAQRTRRSLMRDIERGALHAFKIGREWRVSEDELQRYLTGGTQQSPYECVHSAIALNTGALSAAERMTLIAELSAV